MAVGGEDPLCRIDAVQGGSVGLVCLVAVAGEYYDSGSGGHQTRRDPNWSNTATGAQHSTFKLGSAHVFVDNVHPCAFSRSLSQKIWELGGRAYRGQYLSGQFSTAYHSTIRTDFITKTLPHHSKPDVSVTLQVTITTHYVYFPFHHHRSQDHTILLVKNAIHPLLLQLSHGTDAVILIFDVSQPETLHALNRWWPEFACAVLSNEELEEYCLVVVGNKTDFVPSSTGSAISDGAAWTNSSRCWDSLLIA